MTRALPLLVVAIVLGAAGLTLAHRPEDGESVKELSVQDIIEKLDGKAAAATFVEVTIEPG